MLKLCRSFVPMAMALLVLPGLVSCKSAAPTATETRVDSPRVQGSVQTVYARASGGNSFVYVFDGVKERRLTSETDGWETYPALSPDGALVAFTKSRKENERAAIWVAHLDGSQAHVVSGEDQDAVMPAFRADGHQLLYLISRRYGHSSPIAASRRHDFDVVVVQLTTESEGTNAKSTELTQSYFYDAQSLSVSPDGKHFLLSTYAYPIGSLIQEFDIDHPLRQGPIFQPHVTGEPSTGPSYGEAVYVGDGMNIVFTAASEPADGGNFDYNVYRMSEVTGSDLVQLTHHKGMIDSLTIGTHGKIGYTDANGYTEVSLPPSN